MTTGPLGDMITFSGCRSRCRRRSPPSGMPGSQSGAVDLVQLIVQVGEQRAGDRASFHGGRTIASIMIGPSMRSITISVPSARTSSMRGTG